MKLLGDHCKRLREARDYSIDRLARESEGLSPSVIHRLESAEGAVTVSTLFRLAQVLSIHPKELWDFDIPVEWLTLEGTGAELIPEHHPSVRKQGFKTLLPVYSLKAAAGYFGRGEEVHREGWIEISSGVQLDSRMFVARAVGNSMLPKIRNGDLLVFRADPVGTRQGKIVLAEYRGPSDPDTGGSYTVKVYHSVKVQDRDGGWRHRQVTLSPLNAEYEPIRLTSDDQDAVRVIAEFLFKV